MPKVSGERRRRRAQWRESNRCWRRPTPPGQCAEQCDGALSLANKNAAGRPEGRSEAAPGAHASRHHPESSGIWRQPDRAGRAGSRRWIARRRRATAATSGAGGVMASSSGVVALCAIASARLSRRRHQSRLGSAPLHATPIENRHKQGEESRGSERRRRRRRHSIKIELATRWLTFTRTHKRTHITRLAQTSPYLPVVAAAISVLVVCVVPLLAARHRRQASQKPAFVNEKLNLSAQAESGRDRRHSPASSRCENTTTTEQADH